MVIRGIGVDLTRVARFDRVLARFGPRFLRKAFHPSEMEQLEKIADSAQRLTFVASRWAAKEAAVKAVGLRLLFPQMEVSFRQPEKRPRLVLHGEAEQHVASKGISQLHLSLSHEGEYTTAFVVAEGPA